MKHTPSFPYFANKDAGRKFRATLNMTACTTVISLRLPLWFLETIKTEAHKRGVSYQSYIRMTLEEIFR